jgi:hypothetical protein
MPNFLLFLFFGMFLCAVVGIGLCLVSLFKIEARNSAEKYVFSFAFGSIFYSYVFHVLGFSHLLYANLLIGLYVAPGLIFFGFCLKKYWKNKSNTFDQSWFLPLKDSQLLLIFSLIFFALFPLIPYLFLYPNSWDVLAYHLLLPKFYLRIHSFPFAAWFAQTGFPIGIESLFGLGEALHEPRLSNLIHFTYILATVWYLIAGMEDFFSTRARKLAAFFFLFQPMLYSEVSLSAFVDYPFAFFTLVTSSILLKYVQKKRVSDFVALCALLGFLPLIKFSGLLLVASTVIVLSVFFSIEFLCLRKTQKTQYIHHLFSRKNIVIGGFCFLAFLPASLWFARTALSTGNPFYPFYNDVFKGLGFEAGGKEILKDDILHNAFALQMLKNFYYKIDTVQDYINLSAIGLLALGCIACLLCLRNKRKELQVFAGFYFVTFLLLMATIGPITRYVFFIFPGFGLLIGAVNFDWMPQKNLQKFFVMIFFICTVMLVFVLADSTFSVRQKLFTNLQKREWISFLVFDKATKILMSSDNYALDAYVNHHLDSQKDKVLQLLDNRVYYLDIPSEFANTIAGGYFTNKSDRNVDDVYDRIKADGFTYVIKLNAWGPHPVMRADLFNAFMDQDVTPVATEDGVTLYKLK